MMTALSAPLPVENRLEPGETVVLSMDRNLNRGFWVSAIVLACVGLFGAYQRGAAMPPALLIGLGTVTLFLLWLINAGLNRLFSGTTRPVVLTSQRIIAPDGRALALKDIDVVVSRRGAVTIRTSENRHTIVLRNLTDARAFAATLMDLRS